MGTAEALRRGRAALAVALTAFVAGCGGPGGDKAGGHDAHAAVTPVGKSITLRLITVDDLWASEYAAAVARRSGGSIRIRTQLGGTALLDYERRLIEQVRAGRYDLASVGARAWDRLGVDGFRAFVAPHLIDSLDQERRALTTPRARQTLQGVGSLGLVGLALLPGPLRRPFGLTHAFVRPEDFAGATMGLRYGGVAQDTYRTLGATARPYRIGSLNGLDGAELDPWTIRNNGYDTPGTTLTGNVVLWARPETIVMRRAAFDRLTPSQRDVLRRAAADAVKPVVARLEREQQNAVVELCNRATATVVEADAANLAALRAAVQPVYGRLERDPATRRLISEIRALRSSGAGDVVRCAAGATHAELLEGVWRADVTGAAVLANGGTAAEAAAFSGPATLELRDGRWTFRNDHATVKGTYRVDGPVVALTMRTCTVDPCSPGTVTEYGWSIYRDRLTLTRRPGRLFWPRLVATPSVRVG